MLDLSKSGSEGRGGMALMENQTRNPASAQAAHGGQTAAERFGVVERPDLTYTPEVAEATAHLYERVKDHIPAFEWPVYAPYVHAINKLKPYGSLYLHPILDCLVSSLVYLLNFVL